MKILFICTHNRCRSILCEAITNHLSQGRLVAASAGSEPAGAVHPRTLQHLAAHGIPTDGLYSKSWDELEDFAPDVAVTVCDNAANEVCPVWMGPVAKVHWGLADPSKVAGDEEIIAAAFDNTITLIEGRIRALLALEPSTLNTASLVSAMTAMAGEND